MDGLSTGSAFNGGGVSGYIIDTANSQEMQLTLSGGLGESEVGGTLVNFVPKTGGNTFSGRASSAPPASGRRATTSTTSCGPGG